jgi:hypothetical protein
MDENTKSELRQKKIIIQYQRRNQLPRYSQTYGFEKCQAQGSLENRQSNPKVGAASISSENPCDGARMLSSMLM